MDISSLLGTLVSSDSIGSISKVSGASKSEVEKVLSSALPSLIEGADKQSKGKDTAKGFSGALEQHSKNDTSDLKSFIKGVDLEDGAKIVSHLLGSKSESTQKAISKDSGVNESQVGNIMAAAAPLLMSLLGKETNSEKSDKSATGDILGTLLSNVDVGSLLTGLLGSGSDSSKPAANSSGKKDDGFGLDDVAGIVGSLLKK